MRPVVFVILVVLLGSACSPESPPPSDSGPPSCSLSFLGDPKAEMKMDVVVRNVDGKSVALREGDPVPLVLPPQGGRVVFIGVRVTNVDPCAVKLSGAIRDMETKQIRVDNRTVNLQPTGDGYGASVEGDISTFSNVPMCANQWASTDIFDHPFVLEVSVVERGTGRAVSRELHVTPKCAEPGNSAECYCICRHGYVLGERCDPDAGAPSDAAASDAETSG